MENWRNLLGVRIVYEFMLGLGRDELIQLYVKDADAFPSSSSTWQFENMNKIAYLPLVTG